MCNRSSANAIGGVATFERTHQSTAAPGVSAIHQRASERNEVVYFQRESTERVAGKRVKTGRDEYEIGSESRSGCVNASL